VLAETLRRHHPDWILWAVITDREPAGFTFDLAEENFDHVLTAEGLFGEILDSWLFGMDVVEACTAVKGRALLQIMEEPTAEKILYFDPDTAVFASMEPVVRLLDNASIALTPHLVDPEIEKMGILDNEICSLHYGIFNLGFLAVRNDAEARRFALWWADRLADWCHDRLDIGVFVDQKWCNLIPCFFEGVKIVRDPGYNVASWNLSRRQISIAKDGVILVNDVPLRFFHFTKLGPIGDTMTRRYARDNVPVYEIWWWYSQRVKALTAPNIPRSWWFYGSYSSGEVIPKHVRERYRADTTLQQAFPEPFTDGFKDWVATNLQG
jgi:hypothetical protein